MIFTALFPDIPPPLQRVSRFFFKFIFFPFFSWRVLHTIFAHTEIAKIGATMCQPDFFCSWCFFAPAQKEQLQKTLSLPLSLSLFLPPSLSPSLFLSHSLCLSFSEGDINQATHQRMASLGSHGPFHGTTPSLA
jgi:hypothetical protein